MHVIYIYKKKRKGKSVLPDDEEENIWSFDLEKKKKKKIDWRAIEEEDKLFEEHVFRSLLFLNKNDFRSIEGNLTRSRQRFKN